MALKVFIDTEFTDFSDTHLISIGMVAAAGKEFYAEVPYPNNSCSSFVRDVVIPLLGQIPHAGCQISDLGGKIRSWLEIVKPVNEEVAICYGSEYDWNLFSKALDGRIPAWCQPRLIAAREINKLLLYEFYKKTKLPEHHALYDARANRYAFRDRR